MLNVLQVIFIILLVTYTVLWVVCAARLLIDGELGRGINPLSFWRANTRAFYVLVLLTWRVARVKHRQQRKQTAKEIGDDIAKTQKELVDLAFRDPNNFLG